MKKKILWACLAGMLSGSVFGGGSLYVQCANSVSSCDVYYYLSSSFQTSQTNYFGDGSEALSGSVVFDKGILVSNIVVNPGYLPVVTVMDEYNNVDDIVTNRISGSNGIYSHVPANPSKLWKTTFDLQTILITNNIFYKIQGRFGRRYLAALLETGHFMRAGHRFPIRLLHRRILKPVEPLLVEARMRTERRRP